MSAPHYGDIALDASLTMFFNTTNAEGAPIAPSAPLVAADFEFYVDGVLATITGTPIVYATAQVGVHRITIDTSVDSDFVTATDWAVTIADGTPETVDGQAIDNMIVGTFSIENRRMVGTDGASTHGDPDPTGLIAGLTAARMAVLTGVIDGGRLDLLLDAIPTTAMRGTDGASTHGDPDPTGLIAGLTAARMATLTDWIDGGRLDLLLDAIPTTAMRGTENAALASVATEARLAELDPANLPTDIASRSSHSANDARDAVMNKVIDTLRVDQILAVLLGASAGIASGMGTTSATLRNVANNLNRIAATVDGDGNRSAVTIDVTDV